MGDDNGETVPSRPSGEGRCGTMRWNEEGKLMECGLFGVQQREKLTFGKWPFNPLNAELNPICHLLALIGCATVVVFSKLRVK